MLNTKLLKKDIFCVEKSIEKSYLGKDETESLEFLSYISDSYPSIDRWFINKVVPGLTNGTRKLFIYRRNEKVVALCIAKKTDKELKICTVRVIPEFAGKGLGVKLFKDAMNWLGTDKPHLTVSEDRLSDFTRIFEYFGYKLTSTHNGLYLPGKVEYFYNESFSFKG